MNWIWKTWNRSSLVKATHCTSAPRHAWLWR